MGTLLSAYLFYQLFVGYLSFYILLIVLFIPVLSFILFVLNINKSSLSFQKHNYQIKQDDLFHTTITNISPFMGYCEFKFNNQKIRIDGSYDFYHSFQHCDGISISIKQYRQYDYFHLFYRTIKTNETLSITVFPKETKLDNRFIHSSLSTQNNHISVLQKGIDPTEIYDIHEYHEGDLLKNIHWKLSLKHNKILIKDNSQMSDDFLSIHCSFDDNDDNNDLVFQYLHALCKDLLLQDLSFYLCRQYISSFNEYQYVLSYLIWNKKENNHFIDNHYSCLIDKDGIHIGNEVIS